uniref:SGNH hydrolase-type esterase domain-containing protein n=1 Tax=Chromera velia CCMP2878 TaxID=1169474 RepID=A0A0G4HQ28_9ALVE|eukprot:Cvel_7869.t1-p1 / transcript=Cvel_7869.t1 / gene=Cvel_7869 / organism=Chromera_velia_CCMP2878 / gene_product=hypothetical protein / transcript_product=hypothetical protein / location=Cvel_scaffold421:69776-70519(+) / protein_length=248 / sequence_SO=supercontig / SO=protein_coding / is_pseudo=false
MGGKLSSDRNVKAMSEEGKAESAKGKLGNVLCYGDSLTAGYSKMGSEFTAYAEVLRETLKCEADAIGLCGLTTLQMNDQKGWASFDDVCAREGMGLLPALDQKDYDVLCLLGGTNDLGRGYKGEMILSNLKDLVDAALQKMSPKGQVVVMTVIGMGAELSMKKFAKNRQDLNEGIKTLEGYGDGRVHVFDLASHFPPLDWQNVEQRNAEGEKWDSDALHLSKEGYLHVGRLVCDELEKIFNVKQTEDE